MKTATKKLIVDAYVDVVVAIHTRIEVLVAKEELQKLSTAMVEEFKDVFKPLPHVNELPSEVYCRIKVKDESLSMAMCTYSSPRKWRESWSTLIQEHLDAGRIRLSNSAHASPMFLIPKAGKLALPRWVNDYRFLNANTIVDSYPLPCIDDVMAAVGKAKVWSKLDMTDSFFQTTVHPDDVHLTALTTPLGLYEWLVMPMGLCNAHGCRLTGTPRCDLLYISG